MPEGYVLLSTLARAWGIDKSNARKYVIRHGFDFTRVRGDDRTHQVVLCLKTEEAELVREIRSQEGYNTHGGNGSRPVESSIGVFYVVQIVPDIDPLRLKLGYASDANRRLASYRTVSPTAAIVRTWNCRPSWEQTAIDSVTAECCTLIGGEVYQCTDIERLLQRGDKFFSCLPIQA
ncbi:MAG: hypothetical protein PVS3B3_31200 [Ktedonobacteraceae bacterium]